MVKNFKYSTDAIHQVTMVSTLPIMEKLWNLEGYLQNSLPHDGNFQHAGTHRL
jgi:hypothetical protein